MLIMWAPMALWGGSFLLMAVLAIRLLAGGFWRAYPVFTLYIVTLWAESGVLYALSSNQRIYGKAWIVSRVLVLLLELLVVLSIFGRWTTSFPGIGAFGRGLLLVLIAVSLGLSLSTLPAVWSRGAWAAAYRVTAMTNRFSSACFAFFLLLTITFFSKFGGPVAPNLRRHSWSMAVFATANAVSYFILTTRSFRFTNLFLALVSLLALSYWIFAFRGSGEAQPVTPADPVRWAVADAMNVQLLKLADSVTLTPRGVKKR
jgi:hypothetical protein